MKLFYSPGACSLAPHILLRETQADFELERVDAVRHITTAGADYYGVNPKGQVPLLVLDDGERLSEGPVIAQYVCDHAGRHDLMPKAGSLARYRVMEWQNYITSELHKSFTPLFNPAIDKPAKEVIATALLKKFDWVTHQLEGRHYLTGDTFTAADTYLFAVTGWAALVQLDLSQFEGLQAFRMRIAERPAVRDALRAEGISA